MLRVPFLLLCIFTLLATFVFGKDLEEAAPVIRIGLAIISAAAVLVPLIPVRENNNEPPP